MNKKQIGVIALIVIIISIISIISINSTGMFVSGESKEGLNVAVILPLTGKSGGPGQDFYRGMEIAMAENNINGVNLFVEDDRTSPQEAVTALNKLINTNKIDVIVSLQAQVSMPLLEIANENNIPIVATLTTHEQYTRSSDLSFLVYPLPSDEMGKLKEYADAQGFRKIALMTIQDEFGETINRFAQEYFDNIVANEKYPASEQDYRLSISKIKNSGADAVIVIGYPFHLINFIKQRDEVGLTIPVLGTMHIQSDLVRDQTQDYLDNVYAVTPLALIEGRNEKFAQTFRNNYGVEADFMAPFGYDIVLLLNSIKNSSNIKQALYAANVDGLNGKIVFDEFGEMDMPMVTVEAKTRKIVG